MSMQPPLGGSISGEWYFTDGFVGSPAVEWVTREDFERLRIPYGTDLCFGSALYTCPQDKKLYYLADVPSRSKINVTEYFGNFFCTATITLPDGNEIDAVKWMNEPMTLSDTKSGDKVSSDLKIRCAMYIVGTIDGKTTEESRALWADIVTQRVVGAHAGRFIPHSIQGKPFEITLKGGRRNSRFWPVRLRNAARTVANSCEAKTPMERLTL